MNEANSSSYVQQRTRTNWYNGRRLNIRELYTLESHHGQKKGGRQLGGKDLSHKVELALGMKVMVTDNVEMDLDITNGAQGEIVGIILHLDEPPVDKNEAIVKLHYLPVYILVKLSRTRATRLEKLEEGVVPIEPISTSYRVRFSTKEGQQHQRTIKRRQLPVTAAYNFTDYRSQGQTIPYIMHHR